MKQFYIGSCNLEKWLHQNKAEYTELFFEGCLLDNMLVITKKGIAAIYEHYLNPNASDYLVKFSRDLNSGIYDEFCEYMEKAETENA